MTGDLLAHHVMLDGDETTVSELVFCDLHEAQLRRALIDRGFGADLELTADERAARLEAGEPDAFCYTKQHLVMQSLHIFGGERVIQCGGCPVCAFEGVIEQTTDDAVMRANGRRH
jgi:hypothetical protein